MKIIGIWGLREEARKSWDHIISDKVVYLSETGKRNLERCISEKYLDGDAWFEVHATCHSQSEREFHFEIVTEFAGGSNESVPVINCESDFKRVGTDGNRAMFVHRPEFIQLPQGIIAEGIPSEIRLKRVDHICHCGWKQTSSVLVGGVPCLEDREMDLALFSAGECSNGPPAVCQCPSELIQGRAKVTDEVTEQHGNEFRRWSSVNPNDVEAILKLQLLGNGIGFRGPLPHFGVKRLKVFVRPAGLHFYIDEAIRPRYRHAESLEECGIIGA